MSDNTSIEWTDSTWNPIRARNLKTGKVGWHCEHATTGCEFCYAEGFNKRLGTGLPFKPGHRGDIELFLDEQMLIQPLRWKKPRMIFVCSMTDLFAEFVPDEFIDRMFQVMDLAPQHTFQVLTKRAKRMRDYINGLTPPQQVRETSPKFMRPLKNRSSAALEWPLPNVWLGVSAERQAEADDRIRSLLDTPAAVRFISVEPLLGPIDLTKLCILPQKPGSIRAGIHLNALMGRYCESGVAYTGDWDVNGPSPPVSERRKLNWIIVGGESGSKARPMHPDWARSLRDQCAAAGVPFFFKQWGEWAPSTPDQAKGNPRSGWQTIKAHPHVARAEELYPEAGAAFIERVGKKAAGRTLDGELHNAMPERRA